MKSLQREAPPANRPVPEVWGKLFGKGQAVLDGSGKAAGAWLAAGGTSVGIPLGTPAVAAGAAAPKQAETPRITHQPLPRIGSLIARAKYMRVRGVRRLGSRAATRAASRLKRP